MLKKNTAFIGERLKSARLYNELTISELAEKVGVSKQAISKIETKKIEPKVETLFKLSVVLGFPREYFYNSNKDEIIVGDTYFRSTVNVTNKEKMAQIERVKLLVGIYNVIQEYIEFPKLNIVEVANDFEINNEEIEKVANEIRCLWGLGKEPINNLIDIMERNGIIISSAFTNGKRIDAYSQIELINNNQVAVVVLGDDKESAFRRNFNTAHELGHLIFDNLFNIEELENLEYKRMENMMNYFAGALLIPKEIYLKDLKMSKHITTIDYYINLKLKYKVSASALIFRARQLNAINMSQYQYLMKQISQKGYKICEPFDKETAMVRPRYLKQAMKMIIEEDGVSSKEFIRELERKGLSLNPDMIENILNLNKGYLNLNNNDNDIISLVRK